MVLVVHLIHISRSLINFSIDAPSAWPPIDVTKKHNKKALRSFFTVYLMYVSHKIGEKLQTEPKFFWWMSEKLQTHIYTRKWSFFVYPFSFTSFRNVSLNKNELIQKLTAFYLVHNGIKRKINNFLFHQILQIFKCSAMSREEKLSFSFKSRRKELIIFYLK